MKKIETGNPDELVCKQSASWIWVATLPIYSVVFLSMISALCVFVNNLITLRIGPAFIVCLFILPVLGFLLRFAKYFLRTQLRISKTKKQAVVDWSLAFIPIYRTTVNLVEHTSLVLFGINRLENRYGDRTVTETDYYLRLDGERVKSVTLCRSSDVKLLIELIGVIAEFADLSAFDLRFSPAKTIRIGTEARQRSPVFDWRDWNDQKAEESQNDDPPFDWNQLTKQ